MDRFTQIVSRDFQETVKTWNNKPGFDRDVSSNANAIVGEVKTDNEIYRYVSNGTKRHFVAPRRARALRFRTGYTAKSSPSRISSRNGGASGNFAFSKGHFVSGIKARKFDKQIKDFREKKFSEVMLNALEDALLED